MTGQSGEVEPLMGLYQIAGHAFGLGREGNAKGEAGIGVVIRGGF